MAIATSSAPYHAACLTNVTPASRSANLFAPSGLSLFGFVLVAASLRNRKRRNLAGGIALLLITGLMGFATGCGGNGNGTMNGTQRGTTTVVITGTSGSITHSANVTLTVQ